jgi:peptide/nickel transport system permease protein
MLRDLRGQFRDIMRRHSMLSTILVRVLQTVPVLFGVTFFTFGFLNLLPGDTAAAILGEQATPQSLAILRRQLGLDQPFFTRYGHWLSNLVTGHLGTSLTTHQPIATILAQRVPITLEIAIVAFLEALIVAIPVALLAAWKPRSVADRSITGLSVVGLSFPPFVFALVLILVFSLQFHWLPVSGFQSISHGLGANLKSVLLPSSTIAFGLFCVYARLLRADLVDQMAREEYIELARAKGARTWRLLTRHAFRNSLFGLITVVGLHLGTLISGTVIVESIFGLPGIGQELYYAISGRDAPVVEAIVVLLASTVVVMNLLTDILYSVIDPRVRHGRTAA